MSFLKALKRVLTSFKLRSFFFSIAFFNVGNHFFFSHSFDTLHPFALLHLKSTMTRADAKGYFSLFFALSPISFLLCLVAFTPPEFSFRLLRSDSALILFLFLFHFTTSDLLTPRSSATLVVNMDPKSSNQSERSKNCLDQSESRI